MTTYLITGATGGYGAKALELLAEKVDKKNIYALVRSEEKGAALKEEGFNIRIADYNDKASLEVAFAGIDKVLFVSGSELGNRVAQHQNVIDAAKAASVSFIAYTSLAGLDNVAANFPLGDDHRATEKALAESGIYYTALRNNWYLENEMPLIGAALQSGKFVTFAGEKKAGWVSRDDLAQVGVNILLAENPAQSLELSGKNITYKDIYEAVKAVTGSDIELIAGNETDVVANFVETGMPEELAHLFTSFQGAIAAGFLTADRSDLEAILGRPQTSLADSLKALLT